MINKEKIQMIVSVLLALLLMAGAYFIVIYEPPKNMNKIEDVNTNSDIVSNDPMVTTSRFIKANGTMGNLEKDITQDKMKTGEAISENGNRRLISLSKVENAIIPGSPLITGNEKANIQTFTRDLDSPYIYSIDNLIVSEPSELKKLTVYSEVGPTEYESVEVFASFDSTRTHYTHARDTSYDGTHTQIDNTDTFENIKVILVQSGDLWFVYDIEDSEYLINERFSTWSGIGVSSVDYSKSIAVDTFIIEGIESKEENN